MGSAEFGERLCDMMTAYAESGHSAQLVRVSARTFDRLMKEYGSLEQAKGRLFVVMCGQRVEVCPVGDDDIVLEAMP
jgi:NADH dehydrogenase/NADH:ubiquinone oxidoreductase subunit G